MPTYEYRWMVNTLELAHRAGDQSGDQLSESITRLLHETIKDVSTGLPVLEGGGWEPPPQ